MRTTLLIMLLATISMEGLCQKTEYTYSIPGDSTQNYYVAVHPRDKLKGIILLLPGLTESPNQVLLETTIHKHASDAGYLTIIPALGDWSFFYIDDSSHLKLNQLIEDVFRKYKPTEGTFFIGGKSFGGTMALQYAQRANAENSSLKKPSAVFAIDPPLDIERLFNCMITKNRPTKSQASVGEDNFVVYRLLRQIEYYSTTRPEYFFRISPYSQNDVNHTSLKSILSLPIRIYNEPDITWYIENRNSDYYCMNALDSSAMINWLRFLGNSKAQMIVTSNRGYRIQNKMRHPHSWSIADGEELINWVTTNTKGN